MGVDCKTMPWIRNVSEATARQWEPDTDTVCISITEPGRFADLREGWADRPLRLKFHDFDPVTLKAHGGTVPVRDGKAFVSFHPRQAAHIVDYVTKHRGKNILVHCHAGISRSGAVVDAILQAFPEYEDQGWPRHPNGHVRSLMKRALGLVPIGVEEA